MLVLLILTLTGLGWARCLHHSNNLHSYNTSSSTTSLPSSTPVSALVTGAAPASSAIPMPSTVLCHSKASNSSDPIFHLNCSATASRASMSAIPSSTSTSLYAPASFKHPGLLQTANDFERIRTNLAAGNQPWTLAWEKLLESDYASATYEPDPAPTIYRGSDGVHAQNYAQLYDDVAAAYALAIRYAISQNSTYGDAAVRIMDAWSSTLVALGGDTDVYLAAGIYGYEFAQAGEIMRDYEGWPNPWG